MRSKNDGAQKWGHALRTLAKSPEPITGLRAFAGMQLREEDMFILKSVSTAFDKYFSINNNPLLSEVIHGYLLVCDLSDFKSVVAEGLEKREQTYKQLKASLPNDEHKRS